MKIDISKELENLKAQLAGLLSKDPSYHSFDNLTQYIIDSFPHPIMIIHKSRIILVSNNVARELGALPGGYCWRDFAKNEFISEEDKKYINEHAGALPPGGTKCSFCLADETLAYNKMHIDPDIKAFGRIWRTYWVPMGENCYLHYAIDISDVHQALQNKVELGHIIEKSVNEIYIFDAETLKFVLVNNGAKLNLGYSMEELREMTPLDLKPQFSRERFEKLIAPLRSDTRSKTTFETMHRRKDGSLYPVEVHLQKWWYDSREVFLAIIIDKTLQKKMEERLLTAEKMTTVANLATGVAHELNTPLSAILQSLQVIEAGLDPENRKNRRVAAEYGIDLKKLQKYFVAQKLDFFIKGIRDSALKSSHIINNLLYFSHPQRTLKSVADIGKLMESCVELVLTDYELKKEYNLKKLKIVRDYAENLPPVPCAPIEMEEVFINLLVNAVRALFQDKEKQEKPCITLRTLCSEDMVIIEIEDNGCGISRDTIKNIFDPFFTTHDVGKGTGLGLFVAYNIITERHGGNILVESTEKVGTKFIIKLPLQPDEKRV